MAVRIQQTLVLRGVSVVRDVVTGRTGLGSVAASKQNPERPFLMRHPSRYPLAGYEPDQRHNRANNPDADHAAHRAGRPGSIAGVSVRRSPAMPAGRTSVATWSRAEGNPCCIATWRQASAIKTGFLVRSFSKRALSLQTAGRLRQRGLEEANKGMPAGLALKPAGGALAASTRGSGVS